MGCVPQPVSEKWARLLEAQRTLEAMRAPTRLLSPGVAGQTHCPHCCTPAGWYHREDCPVVIAQPPKAVILRDIVSAPDEWFAEVRKGIAAARPDRFLRERRRVWGIPIGWKYFR